MPLLTQVDLRDATIVEYNGSNGTTYPDYSESPVNAIPNYAYSYYNYRVTGKKLTSVILPQSCKTIGDYAFGGCSALTSLVIPSSVTSIGSYAFYSCSGLSSIVLPSSVESIGELAFYYCNGLTSINIPEKIRTIGIYVFGDCSKLTSVILPSSVTTIAKCAFSGCSGLTSINIPSSVTSIGSAAFGGCTGVSLIQANSFLPIDLSSTYSTVFGVNTATTILKVPAGSKAAYKAAFQWRDFLYIVEMPVGELSATAAKLGATEGTMTTISITSTTDWTANSDQPWLKVSPTTASGNQTLTITAENNPLSTPRTATITISAIDVSLKTVNFEKTTVRNSINNESSLVITVTQEANALSRLPIANAGSDQSVDEGVTVTLDGSASSDPDNNTLTYLWTAPVGITLSSITATKPTYTAPEVLTDTDFTFSLVVNDGTASSTADQVIVTVKQVNKAPIANAGPDQSVDEGVLVTLDGSSSSDPDNNALTYLWTAPVGITLSSITATKPSFTAPEVLTNTDFTFTLVVYNGTASSTADQVIITVKQVNKVPMANAGVNQSVNEGVLIALDGSSSSDPDNNILTYLWTAPVGIAFNSNTASKPIFTAPEVSADKTYTFSLVVNDGIISSAPDEVVITVKNVNKTPIANAGSDQSVNEGVLVTLDGSSSSDPDNNALSYLWTAPVGITLSSNTASKPTFTAPEVSADKKYTFSLVVNDGVINSVADEIELTIKNIDHAPYIKDPIKNISINKSSPDQIIDLKAIFADDDFGDILSYSVSSNTNDKIVTAKIIESNLVLIFSDNVGSADLVITASSNGKEVKSNFKVEVIISTGIDQIINDSNVQIYPNPTKGNVQLIFDKKPGIGTLITVYNISGKIISKSLVNNKDQILNLSENSAGLYFIKIDQKTSKTYKLIID